MLRLPFDYVCQQVDQLYDKQLEDQQQETIHKHCQFIAEFIVLCGWQETEFFHLYVGMPSTLQMKENIN